MSEHWAGALSFVAVLQVVSALLVVAENAAALDATPAEKPLATKIVTVTIYSNRAQVTRRGEMELEAGTFAISCKDLPDGFIESSLQVEGRGSAAARIVGIDLRRRGMDHTPIERYAELEERFDDLKSRYEALRIQKRALEKRATLNASIGQFSLDKAQDQLARETFSTEDWKALLDFLEAEDVGTQSGIASITAEMEDLYKRMSRIRDELKAMRAGDAKGKDVVIDCDVTVAGTVSFDISYLVPGASWVPEYTVYYLEREQVVELDYNAKIGQSTGEDWNGVSVLLSTAMPHAGAAPPTLDPFYLRVDSGRIMGTVVDGARGEPLPYANVVLVETGFGAMTLSDGSYTIAGVPAGTYTVRVMMLGFRSQERDGVRIGTGTGTVANFALEEAKVGAVEEIVVEAELPQIEVTGVKRMDELHVRGGRSGEMEHMSVPEPLLPAVPRVEAEIATSPFAANLQIRKAVDLETGAEPKRSLIVRERFTGAFSLYSVPRLSEHVFVEGKLANVLDLPLLPGMAEVYVETVPKRGGNRVSNFVGREPLDPVASGGEFTLHLGIDQDAKIEHELEKKEYLTKAGSKKTRIRFGYLISLENFKEKPVEVSVVDRIPVSLMREVKVEDIELAPEPTKVGENGIIVWKLPVGAGGKGEIRIAYTIEFPGDWPEEYIDLR